jgi:hypothetical protein
LRFVFLKRKSSVAVKPGKQPDGAGFAKLGLVPFLKRQPYLQLEVGMSAIRRVLNAMARPLILTAAVIVASTCFVAASQSVTLAWDASPDERVIGYILTYGASSGQYDNSIDLGAVTETTITDLEGGVTYYFAVLAYCSGNYQSEPSNEVVYTVPVPNLQENTLRLMSVSQTDSSAVQLWFWHADTGSVPTIWRTASLNPIDWQPLPAEWVSSAGEGVYGVLIPASNAGSQGFFMVEPSPIFR